MNILGIGISWHDPSAAILVDGKVVAAVEEERFLRKKHASNEVPVNAVRYCLETAGLGPDDIDLVAFPWSLAAFKTHAWTNVRRNFRRNPSKALRYLYRGAHQFEVMDRGLKDCLRRCGFDAGTEIEYVEHHLAHASSAYHLSGHEDAAILTVDGVGEFTTCLMAEGRGGQIRKIHEIIKPDSLGLYYSTMTDYLGFSPNDGEFKVMGMSAYGDPSKADLSFMIQKTDDGFRTSDDFVWVSKGRGYQRHRYPEELVRRLGPPRTGDALSEPYVHIAARTQRDLEEQVLHLIERWLGPVLHQHRTLCFAGGCALNVRLNRKILAHPLVDRLWVQPAAHDAGIALGAATFAAARRGETVQPMTHAYLGPSYGDREIQAALEKLRIPSTRHDDIEQTTAELLAQGEIVGWFQGRMEYGPRALGNRSILGHPAHPGMSDEINARIKFREKWRPFCPSILEEKASEILGHDHPSPYMTFSFEVAREWRERIPEAVHVDGTARPQIVTRELNPRFHRLLTEFEKRTGLPVLINTSLNRRGEPMICSPEDALDMFFGSGLEILVLGNHLVSKRVMTPDAEPIMAIASAQDEA